jgi:phage terminase large subunit
MLAQERKPLQLEFPKKLAFLLKEPARLKILYGGRGGGKSINSVRAAIIFSRSRKLEIVCFRELQKSIQESIHGMICNEIAALDLNDEFDIGNTEITNIRTGSRFTFEAVRFNISKIKSRARIDIALLEEADNISKSSLDILMPTVRGREYAPNDFGGPFGKGPEIWILFNPKLDSDEVYKRFILKKDIYAPDFDKEGNRYAIIQKINWSDNKWFPKDQRTEMELTKNANLEDWLHIWEGNTKQVLDGAIYSQEIKKTLLDGRRGKLSYSPDKPVHTFWDLGHDDYTSIWFVQQIGVEYNLISFYQNRLQKIAHYVEHLQNLQYNYGYHYLPHDADNETLASRSVAKIVRGSYPGKVRVVPRVSQKVLGIRAGRQVFDLCNFDEENTADGWQCLCRYQYDVNDDGKWSANPRHDEYSHGADAFQTFALSLKPEQATKKLHTVSTGKILTINTSQNKWMQG